MSEKEELELAAAFAARGRQQMGGILLGALDPGRIAKFCAHCDSAASSCNGFVRDQERYVARNWCGWSFRGGKRLDRVTSETITVGGQEFTRQQLPELDAALEKREQ